jgi:putative tricarboxylic transport membrane protein
MRNPDQFSSLIWLLAGIAIAGSSLKYGFGSFQEPGIGFITFFAGAFLAFLALLLLVTSRREQKMPGRLWDLWTGLDVKKVIYVLVLLALYTFLLRPAGFLVSTFILLSLLFRVKGAHKWATAALLSILVTGVSYFVFEMWLQVQLPKGIVG